MCLFNMFVHVGQFYVGTSICRSVSHKWGWVKMSGFTNQTCWSCFNLECTISLNFDPYPEEGSLHFKPFAPLEDQSFLEVCQLLSDGSYGGLLKVLVIIVVAAKSLIAPSTLLHTTDWSGHISEIFQS